MTTPPHQWLDYAQLEGLWITAGGEAALAPTMAAIALAESGGNPNATNPTDNGGRQTSWGLWQISDGTHNQPVPNILDPLVNAQQAVAKWRDQGLTAWGTYDSGAWRRYYLNPAPAPIPWNPTPAPPPPEATDMDNITFVTFLYRFLLYRAPDPGGLAAWVGELDKGAQRSEVWAVIQNSPEGQAAVNAQRKSLGLPPQPAP
jgi:hypothetical protein